MHAIIQQDTALWGSEIEAIFNQTLSSPAIKRLAKLFESATFDRSCVGSSLYSRGNVLLAHRLMQDSKQELVPLLHMCAHIDAYMSMARLYREQDVDHAPICFATFIDSNAPYVQCQKAWTPLIPTKVPVLNTINWSPQTHTKIVLTGPNGSGKSTVMKSVCHAIIMAQAWGLCPAHEATLSIFAGLRSSLSPREDLQQNISTFMAEKRRIDDIKYYIDSAATDKKPIFVVLDEPYRGTVESEAAYRIDLFARHIQHANYCMAIMATHLEQPTLLEQETKGVFANYQLGLEELASGRFVRTFQLLPGFAQWWFTDPIKRRRFIDQLLEGN
jgi:DNA mismatch repair ATPase MutS